MVERIRKFLFPEIDAEAQEIIDKESVSNIHHLSFTVVILEAFTLALFVLTSKQLDHDAWISIGSVLFCALTCLSCWIIAGRILKKEETPHLTVTIFKVIYFVLLSLWAIWISRRHYLRGEQLLTFFSVELMMVCFVPLRPLISIGLITGVHAALYVTLRAIDGATGINMLNYLVFTLVSIVGMMVRYHSQIRTADKTIQLEQNNKVLAYANRHDGLTRLRNRKALEEDVASLTGNRVSAFMIDINYFKEINDVYGHMAGDEVLAEAARRLKELFPVSHRYRFGGDEFLVLSTEEETFKEDMYQFSVPSTPNKNILLSIGRAEGCPQDRNELFELIAKADASLYEVKKKTHTAEYGGHDRRRGARK